MSTKRRSTRRQFLQGRAALDALQSVGHEIADSPEPTAARALTPEPSTHAAQRYLVEVQRSAMACQFAVLLNAGQHPEAPEVAIQALDLVEQLEDQMSVYREHSDISRINRLAGSVSVGVEPRLFELLQRSAQLFYQTGGAFDITAGPLSKAWGFYRRQGRLPEQAQIDEALKRVGSQWLQLCDEELTIRFARPDMELNLGAIGKGHALDRCAELLSAAGVESFLLHGGQSSVLARGTRARGDSQTPGWTVGVQHPMRPERRIAEIRLHDRALGTSGSGTQFFHHKGKRYAHILDPRTGWPADTVLSSTVIAPDAATADALATAFYVMGLEPVQAYCHKHRDIAAIMVVRGPKAGSADVVPLNLPDEQWERFDSGR